MLQPSTNLRDRTTGILRSKVGRIYGVLVLLNLGAWLWAILAFHSQPAILGIGLVVYGLGLRHALDADHIAAIDNVTRKLRRENKPAVSVGFFFALGHSLIVILGTLAVVSAATWLAAFRPLGATIATAASALFLLLVAVMNGFIFISVYQRYRRVRAGADYHEQNLDELLDKRGLLARVLRPIFRLVTRSWHMITVGFLFGLGFDTASEVAVFGLSATQADSLPLSALLVFPVLFGAGMMLIDTTDGILMLKAYTWSAVDPLRKLYYNMSITLISVVVAVVIGAIEIMGLLRDELTLSGGLWDGVDVLEAHSLGLGCAIIALFLGTWTVFYVVQRLKSLRAVASV